MSKNRSGAVKHAPAQAAAFPPARPLHRFREEDLHRLLRTARCEIGGASCDLLELEDGGAGVFSALRREALGRSWIERVSPLDHERVYSFIEHAAPGAESLDYRLVLAEQETLWVRHWIVARDSATRGGRVCGLLQTIAEEKRLESECLRIAEHVRSGIGQELHDDICQVLAGLSYMMRVLQRRAGDSDPDLGREIGELSSCLTTAMNRTRAMAHGLFPARVGEGTLRDALHELAEQMRTRFDFTLHLSLPSRVPPHSPEQIAHVYRIAQEAVRNAIRHGEAHSARLVIRVREHRLEVLIEDDGRGFPPVPQQAGIGMQAMRHRAQLLGGAIDFGNRGQGGAYLRLVYANSGNARRTAQAA